MIARDVLAGLNSRDSWRTIKEMSKLLQFSLIFHLQGAVIKFSTSHPASTNKNQHDNDSCGTLTLAELKKALAILAEQNLRDTRICLFIDGLDEYVGDQLEIVSLITAITRRSSAIKAVVSSRPEPTFVEAFQKHPKLRVEDLTAGDIHHYATSKLLRHSRIQSQADGGVHTVAVIAQSIALKACGVFLWVSLVVRSLLESLSDGGYIEDLEEIIQEYPEELHELYEHMFERMKPAHRAEAYRLFKAISVAQEVESKIPSGLRLSFLERDRPYGSVHSPLKTLTEEELKEKLSSFEARLRSRCCGLFEIHYFDRISSGEVLQVHEGNITHLHRTVSDFLDDIKIQQVIDQATEKMRDEIHERLAASILYSFKGWRFLRLRKPQEWKVFAGEIASFLVYLQRCESLLGAKQSDYIEELDTRLTRFWEIRSLETRSTSTGLALGNYNHHWAESVLYNLPVPHGVQPDPEPLLSLAARCGLTTYFSSKLEARPAGRGVLIQTWGRSLAVFLSHLVMASHTLRTQHLAILRALLVAGLKVNTRGKGTSSKVAQTLWQEVLHLQPARIFNTSLGQTSDESGPRSECLEAWKIERLDIWIQLIELLVEFGADLEANCDLNPGWNARDVILNVKSTVSKETSSFSAEELQAMLDAQVRMERLLTVQPAKLAAATRFASVGSHHDDDSSLQLTKSKVSNPRQKHRRLRSPKKEADITRIDVSPEPFSTEPVDDAASRPCGRCKAMEGLAEMGFSPSELLCAVQKAGVGYDLPALAAWILDGNCQDSSAPQAGCSRQAKSQNPQAGSRPVPEEHSSDRNERLRDAVPRQLSRASAAKQWSVVAKTRHESNKALGDSVVGAEWVLNVPEVSGRAKSRRARARSANITTTDNPHVPRRDGATDPSGTAAGAVELARGTFTWFFEPKGQDRSQEKSLTEEQQSRLGEFVRSLVS